MYEKSAIKLIYLLSLHGFVVEPFPASSIGYISHQWSSDFANHLVRVPSAHAVPLGAPPLTSVSNKPQIPFTPFNQAAPVTQTSSQGFVPIGLGNDSDVESLQQFPIKENVPSAETFRVPNLGGLSDNQITPDSSRSGYVSLPRPEGGVGIPQPSGVPSYTQKNGLFQLRPQAPPQHPQTGAQYFHPKDQTYESSNTSNMCVNPGGKLNEQYASGQMSYPSPVPDPQQGYQFEGSYLLPQTVIPERDTPPFSVPQLNLFEGQQVDREANLQDTLSTITGSVNQSMDTPRTVTSSGSPKSSRQVTPKNSSGSSSSKSVHFQIQDNPVKDLSKSSKTSHQTQTDDEEHQFNQFSSGGVPVHSHSSVDSSVQTAVQRVEKSDPTHGRL